MATSRRTFLKLGGVAALALAAGGGLYRATHGPSRPRFVMDGEARAALEAIVPAMLAGALPGSGPARATAIGSAIGRVDAAILGLPLASQKEVQDLFGLLALGPARRVLTGIAGGWGSASGAEVARFLQDWRLHRLALLRTAYLALHDLVLGAWYADPSTWAAIGYPGPLPQLAGRTA
jgi:hypothetical protein